MPLTKATTNVVNLNKDTLINSLTIGLGGGNISGNTAVGTFALLSNTTGDQNTAIGYSALRDSTIGVNNTAIGYGSLSSNTTGSNNTAVGYGALNISETGASNTAVGIFALHVTTTGGNNTAVGNNALQTNTTGYQNTAIGASALDVNSNGYVNTAVGTSALGSNTTGFSNTAVGVLALNSNTVGDFNTAIGYSAFTTGTNYNNSTAVGYDAQVTGSNQIQLGSGSTTCYTNGAVQNRSDIRDKADIRDTQLGLDFVNSLRPVDFKWDMREDYRAEAPKFVSKPVKPKEDASDEDKAKYAEELAAYNAYIILKDKWLEDVKLANITHDGSKKRNRFHHGLIAQEVKAVLDAKGIDFGGFQDHKIKGGDDVLSIGYEELIAPILKAIQELSAKVAELEAK